jgi:fructosamine-3-kinase
VRDVGEHHLDLARLSPQPPTSEAALAFGADLAGTHAAGAESHGVGPEGWEGDGFFGPLSEPLPMRLGRWPSWGQFYAEARIAPMVRLARDRGVYDAGDAHSFDGLCDTLADGVLDTVDPPARLHGDLWSGNVMWTGGGAVLIDPAAHGGHRESDLALLALFGAPFLDRILEGYASVHQLADGWQQRVGVHQLHCLLVHAVLFGGGYAEQALRVARSGVP